MLGAALADHGKWIAQGNALGQKRTRIHDRAAAGNREGDEISDGHVVDRSGDNRCGPLTATVNLIELLAFSLTPDCGALRLCLLLLY